MNLLINKSVRVTIAIFAICGFLLIGIQIVKVADAQPPVTLPEIKILGNGSIQSSLSPLPISKTGNTYTITENIGGYGIDIQCSNVLLLGEDNTVQGTDQFNINSGITIKGNGVTVETFQ